MLLCIVHLSFLGNIFMYIFVYWIFIFNFRNKLYLFQFTEKFYTWYSTVNMQLYRFTFWKKQSLVCISNSLLALHQSYARSIPRRRRRRRVRSSQITSWAPVLLFTGTSGTYPQIRTGVYIVHFNHSPSPPLRGIILFPPSLSPRRAPTGCAGGCSWGQRPPPPPEKFLKFLT